jgi:hypothetical protein
MDPKDFLDTVQLARFGISLIAGTLSKEQLKKELIKKTEMCKEEQANMSDKDKGELDEIANAMFEVSCVFDDVIAAKAVLTRKYYDALKKQGFTKAEALAITAAQPIEAQMGK